MTEPQSRTAARPKVCHIIHDDGPGGGPVFIAHYVAALRDEFQSSLIHGGCGRIAEMCDRFGIPRWMVPLDRLSLLPLAFFSLIVRLRRLRPEVVVLHGQWASPVGAVAAKVAGIRRIIYIAHWPAFYTDWGLWRVIRNRIAEALPCHFADAVVTLSPSSRNQYALRRLAPNPKLRMIPYPIVPERIPPPSAAGELRRKCGWGDAHVHVVSVGRLADQKRVDWLLRSWQVVSSQAPEARLWLIGDGPDRPMLERLADELGVTSSCKFLGEQPSGISYVAAADIVAMTSMYESFGLLALEALACGKPIIASAVDGVCDTIRHGIDGFLVPPGNVHEFAERLVQLIDDPGLRMELGRGGQQRAREFDPAAIIDAHRSLIREVLSESLSTALDHTGAPSTSGTG